MIFIVGKLKIVKMSIIPKLIYRVNAILIKISEDSFGETDKLILNFIKRNTLN